MKIAELLEAKRPKLAPEAIEAAVKQAKQKLRGLLMELVQLGFAEAPFKPTTDAEAADSVGVPIPSYKTYKPEDMMAVVSEGPNITVTVYMYESTNKHELDARIGLKGPDKVLRDKINDFYSWVKSKGGVDTRTNRSEPPIAKISLRIPKLAVAQ